MIGAFILTPALAQPLPGWRAVGPERGHVLDVAVDGARVWAASRPGVFASSTALGGWSRAPQFPANVRRLASAHGGGVWAATTRGLWRVDADAQLVAPLPSGGVVVDLLGVDGGAVVGVRGASPGVWRIAESGAAVSVLGGVDPWVLAESGGALWLGTLGQGLWRSDDGGRSFKAVIPGLTVSGLGDVGGTLYVGLSDGQVTRGPGGAVACSTVRGAPLAITEVDGRVVVIVDGEEGPRGDLYECRADGELVPMQTLPTSEDGLRVQPTGLWPLDTHRAIVGTFRSGPLLVDGEGARPARTGFRATLTSAVTTNAAGEVLLALMSTGVFRSLDASEWTLLAGRSERPVSDAMDVVADGDRILVVDFEGIVLGRGETWYRSPGAEVEGAGRENGLIEVGVDGAGAVWGRDFTGRLWAQRSGAWTRCAAEGVTRIEGAGDALVLATSAGYRRAACDGGLALAWPGISGDTATTRSDGRWVAGARQLWRDGSVVANLPLAGVTALAARGDEVLVAGDGPVQRCTSAGCVGVALTPPDPVVGVGWLADGRVWVAEQQGSLLVADPSGAEMPVADAAAVAKEGAPEAANLGAPSAVTEAEVPPWRSAGRAALPAATQLKPGAATLPVATTSPVVGAPVVINRPSDDAAPAWDRWAILGGEGGVAALALAWILRRPPPPRRRQK